MKLVLLYKDSQNPNGLPGEWPAFALDDDGREVISPWFRCTDDELADRISMHQHDYDAAITEKSTNDWWWVTKDSIVSRIAACGDDAVVMLDNIIQSQPKVKQILWREFSVFRSDNQELRALAGALAPFGVDPDVIFAYDPLAPKR